MILLVLVALFGLGLAMAATVWSTYSQHDKEEELIFVGRQFRRALQDYNRQNRNVGDGFPKKLDDLLLDPNVPFTRRFLRKIYLDPLTGSAEWGLVKTPTGSIQGVYSLSPLTPLRRVLPPEIGGSREAATSYADWKFSAGRDSAPGAVPGAPSGKPDPTVPSGAAAQPPR